MSPTSRPTALIVMAAALGACTPTTNPPLMFGQAHTLGIAVASMTPQGPDFSLGYRDVDIAIVPVTFSDASGAAYQIRSKARDAQGRDGNNSLSVLGQFDVQTGGERGAQVGLGKFFATGLAADRLADGFKAKRRSPLQCEPERA